MPREYPNDEIFLATVSRRIGLSHAALDSFLHLILVCFVRIKTSFFLKDDVKDVKGRFLIHPMLDEKEYKKKGVIFEMYFMKVVNYRHGLSRN